MTNKSVFGGTDIWQKSEWVLALLGLISGCFAVSVVPFIRKDFGERYLGWLNLFFGYTVVRHFVLFAGLLGAFFISARRAHAAVLARFYRA